MITEQLENNISEFSPYGCIPEYRKPEDAVYDQIFGAGKTGASFDWREHMPVRERQYWIPFCVSFSRCNCAEAVAKKQGLDINFSDRDLGVVSGTGKSGTTLNAPSEAFRTIGIVVESDCPFTNEMIQEGTPAWDDIFKLPDSEKNGKRYFGGNHSWVIGKEAMIDALDHSPLQISLGLGENWENDGVITNPAHISAYHAVSLAHIDAEGKMYIQDSIGKEWKILAADYQLTGIKSFRDLPENWKELNLMNKAKVVKSKFSNTVYVCYPVPSVEYLNEKSSLEGITIPNPIPDTDTLS